MINDDMNAYLAKHATTDQHVLIAGAFSSRGTTQGYLLSNMPKDTPQDPHRSVAWLALVGKLSKAPISVLALLNLDDEQSKIYCKLERWARRHKNALNLLAQKPMQFNLVHMRHDLAKCTTVLMGMPATVDINTNLPLV